MKNILLATTLALGVVLSLGSSQSLEAAAFNDGSAHQSQDQIVLAHGGHGGGHHRGHSHYRGHDRGHDWHGGHGYGHRDWHGGGYHHGWDGYYGGYGYGGIVVEPYVAPAPPPVITTPFGSIYF